MLVVIPLTVKLTELSQVLRGHKEALKLSSSALIRSVFSIITIQAVPNVSLLVVSAEKN
jgi:hypothetical protein